MYEEFKNYTEIIDKEYPLAKCFTDTKDIVFYVEPMFYTQLQNLLESQKSEASRIINEINTIVQNNKKVIFVYDFENPYVKKDDFVLREIIDITDKLNIFVEDKSRGSDYGD